ncbi:hypothetical protein JCM3774_005868 [Rhodotorula dairenensis]
MAHPALGGKGLPPVVAAPVYVPSSPGASSVSDYHIPPQPRSGYHATTAGPPPDLTVRIQLKARYLRLQSKYNRSLEARKDLEIELEEKEATQQRLQDEVDLIIDQIYDSDYAHLLPKHDSLFSEDDDDGSAAEDEQPVNVKAEQDGSPPTNGTTSNGAEAKGDRKGKRKMRERDLDELESERRKELETRYGIDGTRQNVSRMPTPPPAPPQQQAPTPSAATAPPPPPPISQVSIQDMPPRHPSNIAPPYPTQIAPATVATPEVGASLPGETSATVPAPALAPKRLKFKFGGGGGT